MACSPPVHPLALESGRLPAVLLPPGDSAAADPPHPGATPHAATRPQAPADGTLHRHRPGLARSNVTVPAGRRAWSMMWPQGKLASRDFPASWGENLVAFPKSAPLTCHRDRFRRRMQHNSTYHCHLLMAATRARVALHCPMSCAEAQLHRHWACQLPLAPAR